MLGAISRLFGNFFMPLTEGVIGGSLPAGTGPGGLSIALVGKSRAPGGSGVESSLLAALAFFIAAGVRDHVNAGNVKSLVSAGTSVS